MTRKLIAIIAVDVWEEDRITNMICDLLSQNHDEISLTAVVVKCGEIGEVLRDGFNPPVVLVCNTHHMKGALLLGERELNGMPIICLGTTPQNPQEVSSLRQYTTAEGLDVALAVVVDLIFGESEA